MSVLTLDLPRIDPPEILPVAYLSKSSLALYERCPQAFKARYIDKLTEPTNGKMTLGKAAGAALAQHFARQLETGTGMTTEELLDEYADDWSERTDREDIVWETEPGPLKDKGAETLRVYHREIAPDIVPVSVEREFELSWGPDVPFVLTGYLDLETAAGAVVDFKSTDKRWGEDKVNAETEPTIYLAARRAEGHPASRFEYHLLIRTKQATAQVVPTERTDRQLDLLTHRVFSIARSIEWRWINDVWQGTGPDAAWLCRSCGYKTDCPWRRGA